MRRPDDNQYNNSENQSQQSLRGYKSGQSYQQNNDQSQRPRPQNQDTKQQGYDPNKYQKKSSNQGGGQIRQEEQKYAPDRQPQSNSFQQRRNEQPQQSFQQSSGAGEQKYENRYLPKEINRDTLSHNTQQRVIKQSNDQTQSKEEVLSKTLFRPKPDSTTKNQNWTEEVQLYPVENNQQQSEHINLKLQASVEIQKASQPKILYEQFDFLFKIISQAKGRSNIKVTFDDMDDNLLAIINDTVAQNGLKSLNFLVQQKSCKDTTDIQPIIQTTAEPPKNLILKDETIKEYEFLKSQNDVESSLRLSIIFWLKRDYIAIMAQKYNVEFLTIGMSDSFSFKCRDVKKLESFYNEASWDLNSYIILTHECQTENEAIAKFIGLNKVKNNFQQLIGSTKWDQKIYSTKDIQIQCKDQHILEKVKFWKSNHIIFILIENQPQEKCQDFQSKFDQFIADPKNIYKQTENFNLILEKQINKFSNKVDALQSITKNYFYAVITADEPEYTNNQWEVKFFVTYWVPAGQIVETKNTLRLKEEIMEILNGSILLKIRNRYNITLWEKLLGNIYTKLAKDKQIDLRSKKFIQENQQEGLCLDVRSSLLDQENDIASFTMELSESFDNYTDSNCFIQVPDQDLSRMFQKLELSKFFKTSFSKIDENFQNKILIENQIEKDTRNGLEFIVYHPKSILIADIKQKVEDLLIANLMKVQEKIDLQSFVKFTAYQSTYDLQSEMQLLVRSQGEVVTFVVQQETLKSLQDVIYVFKQNQIKLLVEHTFNLESEYVSKYVVSKLDFARFIVPPQISDKQLSIRGEQQLIDQQIKEINKMIQDLKNSMKEIKIDVNLIISEYLQKNKRQELDTLFTKQNCICQIVHANKKQKAHTKSTNYPQWQWSWKDTATYKDYLKDINILIDEAYQVYLIDNRRCSLDFDCPHLQSPGTHTVHLQQMIVVDKSLQTQQKLSLENNKYVLNGVALSPQIAKYMTKQLQKGIFVFDLFLKKHTIQFISQTDVKQINRETQYQRDVQKVKFVIPVEDQVYHTDSQSVQYIIKGLNQQELKLVDQSIQQLIQMNCSTIKIVIPSVDQTTMEPLAKLIKEKALKIEGLIQAGKSITITGITEFVEQIKSTIDIMSLNQSLPAHWDHSEDNLCKVLLQEGSQEYKTIIADFKLTKPQGVIFQISRIQNKHLYLNYIKEQKDLIRRYQQQNIVLKREEQECSFWHGVRGQHPKVIYESIREAFDVTYSQLGMWGSGVYFSTTAVYSDAYSYTLTAQENPQFAGKKVFLYCKVTTGKPMDTQPDQSIRRPPPSFDCVTGVTQNTRIYILYQMDVRRAYPAYEVIYQ